MTDLALAQHGVVHLHQLRTLGLSDSAVRSRAAVGRLRRVHRGVYAVRGRIDHRGRMLAAVLACGAGSFISHHSAAFLLGLSGRLPTLTAVTNPGGVGRRDGLTVHTISLAAEETTELDGIPVTTVARTLLDLAASTSDPEMLRRVIDRAETLRSFDLTAMEAVLARRRGARGAGRLRAALGFGPDPARNVLERAMRRICMRRGLPAPLVNHWVALPEGSGLRPDFLWPDHLLAVETDGFATHGTRTAFESDRARDRRLRLATGIETYRFTYLEVMRRPEMVGNELRALLESANRRKCPPDGRK